ncbi:zinc finger C4H2 domain-containing protein isoform X2 [Sitodiplosis mosellana]|uniref:zinc finger C4H2 domain-containing protein isoform X2 n=1 Tax=Sitodiplosis mosellana TaxID=263140 RepID=UPI002443A382|nr:zinc finger C4H2 domain-containing protein isoform X2 [Sitodiplosis mosellana]
MTAVDERTIYAKLEAMKDIRGKTIQLEKLKMRLIREVENGDSEEKCLSEYRREMELLLQEKMSHVEELRQIHADINAMETVIKQAEENRNRSVNIANRVHEEYLPLKNEIDHMRREYLGLNPLPELHEEEGSVISADRFQSTYYRSNKGTGNTGTSNSGNIVNTHTTPSATFARPALSAHHATVTSLPPTAASGFLAPPPPPVGMRLNKPVEIGGTPNRLQQTSSIGMAHPTFRSDFNVNLRQQPPPMKSCLSCHQQIHRNAPICPLCKAKSRSRNPKKPKKKDH